MDSGDQITVEMRLAAIEEKLDRLLTHLGLDGDGEQTVTEARVYEQTQIYEQTQAYEQTQIAALIQAGKKIQAIKAYREATGQGLKEAKNAVEAMGRTMRADGGRR